jgi:hypothetical protein
MFHILTLAGVISTSLNASYNFVIASSICSKVWVAIKENLIKEESEGTAGETTGLTKIPL